jgi:hypothetical protein
MWISRRKYRNILNTIKFHRQLSVEAYRDFIRRSEIELHRGNYEMAAHLVDCAYESRGEALELKYIYDMIRHEIEGA